MWRTLEQLLSVHRTSFPFLPTKLECLHGYLRLVRLNLSDVLAYLSQPLFGGK